MWCGRDKSVWDQSTEFASNMQTLGVKKCWFISFLVSVVYGDAAQNQQSTSQMAQATDTCASFPEMLRGEGKKGTLHREASNFSWEDSNSLSCFCISAFCLNQEERSETEGKANSSVTSSPHVIGCGEFFGFPGSDISCAFRAHLQGHCCQHTHTGRGKEKKPTLDTSIQTGCRNKTNPKTITVLQLT